MANTAPGKKILYVEIPPDVDDGIRALARERGESLTDAVVMAIRRHLMYPPPPPEEVIPPMPDAPKRPVGRPRKDPRPNPDLDSVFDPPAPKRGRGRPRKNTATSED